MSSLSWPILQCNGIIASMPHNLAGPVYHYISPNLSWSEQFASICFFRSLLSSIFLYRRNCHHGPCLPRVPLLLSLSLMYLAHGPILSVRRHGMQMSHARGLPFDPDRHYHTIDQRRAATASSRGGYKNNTTICFQSRCYCERSSASDDDDVRCRHVATGRCRAWPFSSFEQLWEVPVMQAHRRCLCGHRYWLAAITGRNVGHVVSATCIMLQSTRRANL